MGVPMKRLPLIPSWVELQFVNEQIREVLKTIVTAGVCRNHVGPLQGYNNSEIEQEIGVGGKTIDAPEQFVPNCVAFSRIWLIAQPQYSHEGAKA